jgi:phytoene dehydrogenase-like protein
MRRPALAAVLSGDASSEPSPPGLAESRPLFRLPQRRPSVLVQGFPFAEGFFGDPWPFTRIPFHSGENNFPGGEPPAPTETVDVAIIGGGLSGLATAYFLRHRRPVVLELRSRFGGVSQGETWDGTNYSLGGAYFMTPDPGSFLENFYRELGLDDVYRLSPGGEDPMEINGIIHDDFWSGAGLPPEEAQAFLRYAEIVNYFANESYPDIPLDASRDNGWILALDRRTLKDDLEDRLGMPVPPLLAAGIQSYCYSSFDAGWDRISAASGWNFIAAEEYGRWVCPGGNAWVTDTLWQRLVREYSQPVRAHHLDRLRPDTRAVDVRLAANDRVQVTYKDSQGGFHSLLAKRVVVACSKHIAKYVIHDLQDIDPDKHNAMWSVATNPYVVANVLLNAPIGASFYDTFLLGDGDFPMDEAQVAAHSRVVDMLNGRYARRGQPSRNVLTLYWPLPWAWARFSLVDADTAWQDYADRLAPQVASMLSILNVPRGSVQQVRMTRWGHSMPIAYPGFIADGIAEHARRPFEGRVYFVNQDNWALPAFETCVLEAKTWSDEIDAGL